MCQRVTYSALSIPNNHSLERENSNFIGGLFQGLNIYAAQVCLRVSNDYSNKIIIIAGLFSAADAWSCHHQGGIIICSFFCSKFLSSALEVHPFDPLFCFFLFVQLICFSLNCKPCFVDHSKLLAKLLCSAKGDTPLEPPCFFFFV